MKIKYFNDWLCDHNTYNPKYATANSEVSDYAYFISGALIYGDGDDTSKYPVCQAYALSMKLLCDKVGINDMVAVSSNHMWNIVEVNGKKYYVDTTWNDNWADAKYPTIYSYKYLCIGTDKMKSRDDSKSSHTIVDRYDVSDYLPDTTSLLEDLNIHTESSNFEYSNLDENSDNELDYKDIAAILKNINNPTKTLPYNVNGSTDNKVDLLDAITLSKLMLK
jgi:hypothetical protein